MAGAVVCVRFFCTIGCTGNVARIAMRIRALKSFIGLLLRRAVLWSMCRLRRNQALEVAVGKLMPALNVFIVMCMAILLLHFVHTSCVA